MDSSIRGVVLGSNLLGHRPLYGGRAFPQLLLPTAGRRAPIKAILLGKPVPKLSRIGETKSGDVIELGA